MGRTNNVQMERVQETILEFWKNGVLCDTLVTSCDSAPLMAHSLVLAATSDVLHTELRRYQGSIYKKVDALSKHTRDAIQCVLQYCYTGILKHDGVKKEVVSDMFQVLQIDHKIIKTCNKSTRRSSRVEEGDTTEHQTTRNSSKKINSPFDVTLDEYILPRSVEEYTKENGSTQRETLPVSRKDHLLRSQKKNMATLPLVVELLNLKCEDVPQSHSVQRSCSADLTDTPSKLQPNPDHTEPTNPAPKPYRAAVSSIKKNIPTVRTRARLKETSSTPVPTQDVQQTDTTVTVASKSNVFSEPEPPSSIPTPASPPSIIVSPQLRESNSRQPHPNPKPDVPPRRRVLTKAERKHVPTKLMAVPKTGSGSGIELLAKKNCIKGQKHNTPNKSDLCNSNNSVVSHTNGSSISPTLTIDLVKPSVLCNQCSKSFNDELSYQGHLTECLKTSGSVPAIPKTTGKPKAVKKECKNDTDKKGGKTTGTVCTEFRCVECEADFDTAEGLASHRSMHLGKRKRTYHYVACDLCGYQCRSRKLVVVHKNKKHAVPLEANQEFPVHRCEVPNCNFKTLFEFVLRNHAEIHGEDRPFMCELCSKTFKQKTGLNVHMNNVHGRTEISLTCDCGKVLKSRRALKSHIRRVHEKEKNHKCEHCDYSTFERSNLQQHMFSKHGVPHPDHVVSYACEHCSFVTRWKNQYMNHMRRHTGYHPFECPTCKKSFASSSDLTGHKKWHREKTHKCPYNNCKFASISAGKLKQHIRKIHTHRDIKPFNCETCAYRTNIHGNLLSHIRKVHKIKVASNQHLVKPLEEEVTDVEHDKAQLLAVNRETPMETSTEAIPSTDHMYSQNLASHMEQSADATRTETVQQFVDQSLMDQQSGLGIPETNYNEAERVVADSTYPQLSGEMAAVLESMATPAQQVLYYQQGLDGQGSNIQPMQMENYPGHQGEVFADDAPRSRLGMSQAIDFSLPDFAPPSYEAATAASETGNIHHSDHCQEDMGVFQQQNGDYSHHQPQYTTVHAPFFHSGQPVYSSNASSAYTTSALQELSSSAREFQHQSLISMLPASITSQQRMSYDQIESRNGTYDSVESATLSNTQRMPYDQIDGDDERIPYGVLNESQTPVSGNHCLSYCSSNENLSAISHSQSMSYPSMHPDTNGRGGSLQSLSVFNPVPSVTQEQYMVLPGPEQILPPRGGAMPTAQEINAMQNSSYNLSVNDLTVGLASQQQSTEDGVGDPNSLSDIPKQVQLPIRHIT